MSLCGIPHSQQDVANLPTVPGVGGTEERLTIKVLEKENKKTNGTCCIYSMPYPYI